MAVELFKDKRVGFIAPADYSLFSQAEEIIKKVIDKVKVQEEMYQIINKQRETYL
ncbi:MAG: hypothetical protein ACK5N8_04875 [Alphaproteobacteria bacterium]